ncbi:MAG: hypothetical protein ACFFBF_17145 [Promethearchaeota archaeon]
MNFLSFWQISSTLENLKILSQWRNLTLKMKGLSHGSKVLAGVVSFYPV